MTRQRAQRRHPEKPWFWPGATREDKAKHVARAYRQLVFDITQGHVDDPAGELHRLDQQFIDRGIYWMQPSHPDLLAEPEQWMTAPDLAHLLDRPRKDIYNWSRLGHIEQRCGPDGTPEYRVGSVINYQAKLRQRRTERAK
ncbi:hypothetical protein [Mycobacterium colombiense]